LTRFYCIN